MYKRIPIFLGILLIIAAVWLQLTSTPFIRGLIERLDNLGYDLQIRAYALTKEKDFTSSVAIIDIDDASLKAEGRWPWSRDKIAKLVDELHKQGAAVIAFDIFFSEDEINIAETVIEEL